MVSYYKITAVNSAPGPNRCRQRRSALRCPPPTSADRQPPQHAGSVKLTWSASAGTTLYHIEREVVGTGVFTEVGTTAGLTFTDTGLTGGTYYAYQIRAQNGAGYSAYTNMAIGHHAGRRGPQARPARSKRVESSGQVSLTWTAASGTVSAYHVEREAQGDTSFTEIAGNVTGTSFTDTTMQTGVTYIYRVRAENGGAFGGYTANVTVTTGIAGPTGLAAAAVSTTEIDLSWAAAAGTITRYHIERQDPEYTGVVGNRHEHRPDLSGHDGGDWNQLQLSRSR